MLHKISKKLPKLYRLARRMSFWAWGPLLGLAAFCPLYLFTLAGSWLPHLLLLSLVWLAWLVLKGRKYRAAWLCAWMLLASYVLIPQEITLEKEKADTETTPTQLKLAQVNVLMWNSNHQQVAQHIKALDADILAFQEVNQLWADSLVKALADEYPYYSLAPQDNCYGMALFSKEPLKNVQLHYWESYPAISARIAAGGQETLVLSLHAASPVSRKRYRARNKQLQAAARLIEEAGIPSLVLGDLNTVPWDPALKPMYASAGLKDSRSIHYTATWPSLLGRWGIPIDYVMHSPHWQRISHGSVRIPGSDHKAMTAILALTGKGAQSNSRFLTIAQP